MQVMMPPLSAVSVGAPSLALTQKKQNHLGGGGPMLLSQKANDRRNPYQREQRNFNHMRVKSQPLDQMFETNVFDFVNDSDQDDLDVFLDRPDKQYQISVKKRTVKEASQQQWIKRRESIMSKGVVSEATTQAQTQFHERPPKIDLTSLNNTQTPARPRTGNGPSSKFQRQTPQTQERRPQRLQSSHNYSAPAKTQKARIQVNQTSKKALPAQNSARQEEKNRNMQLGVLQHGQKLYHAEPQEDPPFFNLFIEKRHAYMLSKPSLDQESRLEVIYRVLKDQLKKAKSDLIEIKKNKNRDLRQGEEIKKRVEIAQLKARNTKDNLKQRVTATAVQGGPPTMQLDPKADDPSFRRVANYLLSTDVRRHSRYCACCKEYEVGNEPSATQMGEFLEYIKQLHHELGGNKFPNTSTKNLRQEKLDHDSIDDLTDLEEPGILTKQMGMFSIEEQRRLKKYVDEMRRMQRAEPKKHDCGTVQRKNLIQNQKEENNREVVEMELRVIQKYVPKKTAEVDAHQFSEHSFANQADSDEFDEINIQTDLIDTKAQGVDVYDLDSKRKRPTPRNRKSIQLAKMIDACTQSESKNKKLISTRDWFYSDLNRQTMEEYFKKVGWDFPKELREEFDQVDQERPDRLRRLSKPPNLAGGQPALNSLTVSHAATVSSNPQESSSMVSEAEIKYIISMLKQKSDKWEQPQVLEELHTQACFTARQLTQEMIEGKVPINYQLDQYQSSNKKDIEVLLHRCDKLFSAKADARQILKLATLVFYGVDQQKRSLQEKEKLLKRLKSLCSHFQQENHMYHACFTYRGRDLFYQVENELVQLGCDVSLPTTRQQQNEIEASKIDQKLKQIMKNEENKKLDSASLEKCLSIADKPKVESKKPRNDLFMIRVEAELDAQKQKQPTDLLLFSVESKKGKTKGGTPYHRARLVAN